MKVNKPKNENYAAIVVQIKTLVPLENCDNVQAAIILGNQVIVSKEVRVDDIGLYFPLECQLSQKYLSNNNLYRKPELNNDPTQKGYFEENGRIRCIKFRGMHKSEGLFMPIGSLGFVFPEIFNPSKTGLWLPKDFFIEIGDTFDELNGIEICNKYIPKNTRTPGMPGKNKKGKSSKISKLIANQFKFHDDTGMLYKNLHTLNPDTFVNISYKMHGTSGISSRILCKKALKWYEKALKFLGINIVDTEYSDVYASRKVVKNEELNPKVKHFYDDDIWGVAHKELLPFVLNGMTFYYEIVGFLPSGGYIQKDYDYGCDHKEHKIYIYRITYTNIDGKVFEFSATQVQNFCKEKGLNAVPELFSGKVSRFITIAEQILGKEPRIFNLEEDQDLIREHFLQLLKDLYNEKNCYICKNKVPEEGAVIRLEKNEFEAYKQKSNRFYEKETKELDSGEINIEDLN